MKSTTLGVTLAGMLLASGGAVWADDHPRLDEARGRIHRQEQRINDGIRDGSLSPEEAARLRGELRQQKRELRRDFRSGHSLNDEEWKDLNKDLDRSSKDIYREKHD
jgi:predicted esterase